MGRHKIRQKSNLILLGPNHPHLIQFPLRCNTFLLLSLFVTVYFRNDLITDCFFKDKFKNIFIAQ